MVWFMPISWFERSGLSASWVTTNINVQGFGESFATSAVKGHQYRNTNGLLQVRWWKIAAAPKRLGVLFSKHFPCLSTWSFGLTGWDSLCLGWRSQLRPRPTGGPAGVGEKWPSSRRRSRRLPEKLHGEERRLAAPPGPSGGGEGTAETVLSGHSGLHKECDDKWEFLRYRRVEISWLCPIFAGELGWQVCVVIFIVLLVFPWLLFESLGSLSAGINLSSKC